MSYDLWIPRLPVSDVVTAETLKFTALKAADAYLAGWSDDDPIKTPTEHAIHHAIGVAQILASQGVVGQTFRVHIQGHANPTPGAPQGSWSNDYCTVTLQALKAPVMAEGNG
jgi:hypothetical protein